jgi:hypothetical protein
MYRAVIICLTVLALASAEAHEAKGAHARYIANTFDTCEPVPPDALAAILAGDAPWDRFEAIFVSHYHADHFDPAALLKLLESQAPLQLYGPSQAAEAMLSIPGKLCTSNVAHDARPSGGSSENRKLTPSGSLVSSPKS